MKKEIVFVDLPYHGLGNKLWIWAKALCFARDAGLLDEVKVFGWTHINPDRYLLNKFDKRNYRSIFRDDASVSRMHFWLLRMQHKIPRFFPNQKQHRFRVMGSFEPLYGQQEFVKEQLIRILNPDILDEVNAIPQRVAVHIRLGDFKPVSEELEAFPEKTTNTRVPLKWYKKAMYALVHEHPSLNKFTLFSDGTKEELADIVAFLKMKDETVVDQSFDIDLEVDQSSNPMTALLRMSTASFLIGSNSTYSYFANYFGQMPSLYFPGSINLPRGVVYRKGEPTDLMQEWKSTESFPLIFNAEMPNRKDMSKSHPEIRAKRPFS